MDKGTQPRLVHILVVDDSAFMRTALKRMIESDPALVVIDTASTGAEALEKVALLKPEVITLDIEMPGMSGLDTLKRIMQQSPRPVLMISSLTQDGAEITLECLAEGAFDYIPKQLSYVSLDIVKIQQELIAKIKAAAQSSVAPRAQARRPPNEGTDAPLATRPPVVPAIAAIGTSTGGPRALQTILPMLPADVPVPIVIVQHMPVGFTGPFAKRLDKLCRVRVCEAQEGDVLEPGAIYIAPAGWQLTVVRRTPAKVGVHLSHTPVQCLHVPAVDVMMNSVAEVYGPASLGIIMTGMGSDGLIGMRAISREGGITIGQDEASCIVYGMPRSCAEAGILTRVSGLMDLPRNILQVTRYKRSSAAPLTS